MTTIDPFTLTRRAMNILEQDLTGHGNVLSTMHSAALHELLHTFSSYCIGHEGGRKAFALPCGAGKTSAVIAFLTALHETGCLFPVSVAASKVEALCNLKRDLMAHGVPENLIGLKHSAQSASLPSTGSDNRVFQLVTHARIRGGTDFDLFGMHKDEPRRLCIWDESLIASDAFVVSATDIAQAAAALEALGRYGSDHHLAEFCAYLSQSVAHIDGKLAELTATRDVYQNGLPISLGEREPETIEAWGTLLGRYARQLQVNPHILHTFLDICQLPLQVLNAGGSSGVVAIVPAVPRKLHNVVVLDASGPIRELVRLDTSIRHVENFAAEEIKSFEDVRITQVLAAGGRRSMELGFKAKGREASAVSKEVISIIKKETFADPERAFLIFTFKENNGKRIGAELRDSMDREGFDLTATLSPLPGDSKTAAPRLRYELLTWGQHESLNGREHAATVILCGVLYRERFEIAGAVKGQEGYLRAPTPQDVVKQVIDGEIAHCVMQAASRGSCRHIINGKAKAMNLYLIHRDHGLQGILKKVMPGAVWNHVDPTYLTKAKATGQTETIVGRILDHLKTVPLDEESISCSQLKKALCMNPSDTAMKDAFTLATTSLTLVEHGWALQARSLVRASSKAYGFVN